MILVFKVLQFREFMNNRVKAKGYFFVSHYFILAQCGSVQAISGKTAVIRIYGLKTYNRLGCAPYIDLPATGFMHHLKYMGVNALAKAKGLHYLFTSR